MEAATLTACQAPLQILECCANVLSLLEEMLEKGSLLLLPDVGCGTYLCRAAMESAALSVFVNTGTLKDRNTAADLEGRVDSILHACLPLADRITASVTAQIRKEA